MHVCLFVCCLFVVVFVCLLFFVLFCFFVFFYNVTLAYGHVVKLRSHYKKNMHDPSDRELS